MSDRQADVRDEGTPVSAPAQKLPTLAPDAGGRDAAPARPLPGTLEDKPQVRGKGPKGRERRPARTRAGKARASPAKPKGPARATAKPSAKKATTKKGATRKGTAKKGAAKKEATKKAAGRKAYPGASKGAQTRKARKMPKRLAGDRKDSGGARPRKSAGTKATTIRGAAKKGGGRSPTQGGRGGTAKGKRRG